MEIVATLRTAPLFVAFAAVTLAQSTIVFTHAPDGGPPWPVNDIYSVRSDGTGLKALTTDGHSHGASWSPDVRQIVFIHDATLQILNADGTNRRLLRRIEPSLSPSPRELGSSSSPQMVGANRGFSSRMHSLPHGLPTGPRLRTRWSARAASGPFML